jgi:hypothetical protein
MEPRRITAADIILKYREMNVLCCQVEQIDGAQGSGWSSRPPSGLRYDPWRAASTRGAEVASCPSLDPGDDPQYVHAAGA